MLATAPSGKDTCSQASYQLKTSLKGHPQDLAYSNQYSRTLTKRIEVRTLGTCTSVIMPVYNTPTELLRRAINSCLTQSGTYELIIVDDGSLEETSVFLDSFADEYPHLIHVIHKQNGGISSARNRGVSLARGEYITFLDSDDEFTEGFLESAVKTIESTGADIVLGAQEYIEFNGQRQVRGNPELGNNTVIIRGDKIRYLQAGLFDGNVLLDIGLQPTSYGSCQGVLYRSSLFNEIRYNESLTYFEDLLFNLDAFGKSNAIAVTGRIWYLYHQVSSSITNKLRPRAREDLLAAAEEMERRREGAYSDLSELLDLGIIECFHKTIVRSVLHKGFYAATGVSPVSYIAPLIACDVYKGAFRRFSPNDLRFRVLKFLFLGNHPLLILICYYLNVPIHNMRSMIGSLHLCRKSSNHNNSDYAY
jgi:glycosyltransferase involved in cell wall biosynthesis